MFGKPLRFKPLPSKIKKDEIAAELVHFRKAAGIPTQDDHFDNTEMTVRELRALHAKCLKAGNYPLGRLELIDLIVAAKNRHSNGRASDPVHSSRKTFDHPMYTLKYLRDEWKRLLGLLREFYPSEKHGPRKISKPLKAA